MTRAAALLAGCCYLLGAILHSDAVWDTTVNWTVQDSTVCVNFSPPETSKYNYTAFSIDLWLITEAKEPGNRSYVRNDCDGLSGQAVLEHTLKARLPSVNESFENIGPSGYYCIRVSPLSVRKGGSCQSGCRTVSSDVFFLLGNNKSLDERECDRWNVFIDLILWTTDWSAVVSYNVSGNVRNCLRSFEVDLWYGVEGECDGTTGYPISSRLSHGLDNILYYHNLKNGTYCVRILPSESTCRGRCLPRYSVVKTFYKNVLPVPTLVANRAKASELNWSLPIVLCAVLVSGILLVLGSLRWRQRKGMHRVGNKDSFSEGKTETKMETEPTCCALKEVILLNTYKNKAELRKVRHLADFLRCCCGLRTCMFDEEIHHIPVSPEDWVAKKLTAKNSKIVVVESPEFISFQKCSNNCFLDQVFCYALDFLKAVNSLDYGKVFVVRFCRVPPDSVVETVVPCKRYNLPDHLHELYCDLVDICPLNVLKDADVLQMWKSEPSYLALYDDSSFTKLA